MKIDTGAEVVISWYHVLAIIDILFCRVVGVVPIRKASLLIQRSYCTLSSSNRKRELMMYSMHHTTYCITYQFSWTFYFKVPYKRIYMYGYYLLSDLKWLLMTSNGLWWPHIASNDLKRPRMSSKTKNGLIGLQWPSVTSNELQWPHRHLNSSKWIIHARLFVTLEYLPFRKWRSWRKFPFSFVNLNSELK